jgi:hypothetical protein
MIEYRDRDGDRLTIAPATAGIGFFVDSEGCAFLEADEVAELHAELGKWLEARQAMACATSEAEPPTITAEAEAAVYGDRQGDYGHPREDFTRTAIIWTGLLHHKLADGAFIEAEDVPRCMIGVKLARDVHAPKRDNRVDGAGYFLTLDRLETGR